MNVNFPIDEETNKKRIELGATWKELVLAGLDALTKKSNKVNPEIEKHLKDAVRNITSVWELIKKD